MTKDEALNLALDALQAHGAAFLHHELRYEEALTAYKEALAQPAQELDACCAECGKKQSDGWFLYCVECVDNTPAQEPVAMRYDYDGYGYKYIDNGSGSDWQTRIKDAEPVYTTPPQRPWVGLTDDEIKEAYAGLTLRKIYQTIEAKLKEKNNV